MARKLFAWQGATIEARYEVEYRWSTRRDWEEIDYPRGVLGFGTLAEAKRMAEEDREQRARELADEQALEPYLRVLSNFLMAHG